MKFLTSFLGNPLSGLKYIFYIGLVSFYLITSACSGQKKDVLTDIFLKDSQNYTGVGVSNISNVKYPPDNLFDANLSTCWVSGSAKSGKKPSVFIRLPESGNVIVNIFPGYGKSKNLFEKNARPKKLIFSVYAAVNPDGYVSETGMQYKAMAGHDKQVVQVKDRYGVQSFPLTFNGKALQDLKANLLDYYRDHFDQPVADTCLILKIEIAESYPGSQYDDIFISEIFFNDRFVTPNPSPAPRIEAIYLNTDENALLADINGEKGIRVYSDTTAVLQLIEQSDNKKWAIFISMPVSVDGRAETTYLLVDLFNKKVVNGQLEKCTGYPGGSDIYFETGDTGILYLVYSSTEGRDRKIALY